MNNANNNNNNNIHCNHGDEVSEEHTMCNIVMLSHLLPFWEEIEWNLLAFQTEINALDPHESADDGNGRLWIPFGKAGVAYHRMLDRAEAAIRDLKVLVGGHVGIHDLKAFLKEPRRTRSNVEQMIVDHQLDIQRASHHRSEFELCGNYTQEMMEVFTEAFEAHIFTAETLEGTPIGSQWVCLSDLRAEITGLMTQDGVMLDTMRDLRADIGVVPNLDFDPKNTASVRAHARLQMDRNSFEQGGN